MKTKQITPFGRALGIAATMLAMTAFAQDATRLTKPEAEALTIGKEVKYLRAGQSTPVLWDFRKDGSVWYTARTAQRNLIVGGTYTVEDDASVCLKWREDKYITLTDACYYFAKSGDKTTIANKRNPDRIIGDLVE